MNYKLAKLVGENVRKVRESSGYSLIELARVIKRTPPFVGFCERGLKGLSLESIVKICNKFDVTPNQLSGYDPLPKKYQ